MSAELEGELTPRETLEGEMGVAGSGTSDYEKLVNLPQINGVTLIGNKTAKQLGIVMPTKTSELNNDSGYVTIDEVIDDDIPSDNTAYSSEKVDSIIEALLPVDSASGSVATFSTALVKPLISIAVDDSATKVYQRGANLWDEEWELGTYNTNTGAKSSSSTRIRSKNLFSIPNVVGSNLYITPIGSGGNGLSFLFYDKDGTFKNGYYRGSTAGGFSFTIQEDWYYMAISPNENYGTTYNNDISIRLDNNYNYSSFNPLSDEYDISELANINTFIGMNNIFADSGNIEVRFKDSIQHYVDKII